MLSDKNYENFAKIIKEIENKTEMLISFHIRVGLITIIFILLSGYLITNTITSRIKLITYQLQNMDKSTLDLSELIKSTSGDEIGTLLQAFYDFTNNFKQIIDTHEKKTIEIDSLNKNLNKKFEEFASLISRDELTGLKNYSFFKEELLRKTQEYRNNRGSIPLSLMIIDTDNFKTLNNKFGHILGDTILRELAGRIVYLTTKKQVVCRYGGAKFAVILTNSNLNASKDLAEQIRKYIEEVPIQYSGGILNVTVSIGCASYFSEENDLYIQTVDSILNTAKNSGGNQVLS